jgi:protease-4
MRLLAVLGDLLANACLSLRNQVAAWGAPDGMYVQVEWRGPFPQHRTHRPWWARRQPDTIDDARERLEQIGADPRAAGVIVMLGGLETGLASLQSLRAALAACSASGKRVVVYVSQASTSLYYLASAADTVVMPESGTLDLVGVTLEATFLGDALKRFGVSGEFERIAEYKSAVEPLTRGGMSEPMREALNAVLDSVYDDLVAGIAAARGLDPDAVRRLIDAAPLSARAAAEAGLVDAVLFEDELGTYLARGGRPPAIVPWPAARRRLSRPLRRRRGARAIALITLRGPIVMGESRGRPPLPVPLFRGEVAGHATVARAVRAVERSRRFGALVVSIDSPGGSALASDLIWREIERVGRRKPVVAFFGNVAASGGYYVAAAAQRIVCEPGTLTGSIGVISGKLNVRGLFERLGVHREILARGDAATMASAFVPFSAEERRRLLVQTEVTYARFVDRVARGRGMTPDAVQAVARGRVWTGRQAKERGLVDVLGDFRAAVNAAKELTGAAAETVPVVHIRPPRGPSAAPEHPVAALAEIAAGVAALLEERVLALFPWEVSVR